MELSRQNITSTSSASTEPFPDGIPPPKRNEVTVVIPQSVCVQKKCGMSNMSKCILIMWILTIIIVLAMTLPVGLRADEMFQEQGVGEIGVNGRLVRMCNATLKKDNRDCSCVCGKTYYCHRLEYALRYIDVESNTTMSNDWTSRCHCSDYENVVIEGTIRCTIDEKDMSLEGYGNYKGYKVTTITLVAVFASLVFCCCGCGGTLFALMHCDTNN